MGIHEHKCQCNGQIIYCVFRRSMVRIFACCLAMDLYVTIYSLHIRCQATVILTLVLLAPQQTFCHMIVGRHVRKFCFARSFFFAIKLAYILILYASVIEVRMNLTIATLFHALLTTLCENISPQFYSINIIIEKVGLRRQLFGSIPGWDTNYPD